LQAQWFQEDQEHQAGLPLQEDPVVQQAKVPMDLVVRVVRMAQRLLLVPEVPLGQADK
jgi:hypothetical protein